MKRTANWLYCIFYCLPLWLSAAVKPLPVYHTASAPVIDGQLDDLCWRNAKLIRVTQPHDPKHKTPAKPPMTVKLSWDANYLYLAYKVIDSNIIALGTGRQIGPADNQRQQAVEYAPEKNIDLAEFFIAIDSPRFFWEIHHNAANHLNTLWVELPTNAELTKIAKPGYHHIKFHRDRFLADDGSRTLRRAVHLLPKTDNRPSTTNQPNDDDRGYSGELRLPWRGLVPHIKTIPKAGITLSLLAVNLNGINGQAIYHSSGKQLPKLMYHYSAARWPKFILVD